MKKIFLGEKLCLKKQSKISYLCVLFTLNTTCICSQQFSLEQDYMEGSDLTPK